MRADLPRERHGGAGLLAHELGEAAGQVALPGVWIGAEEHVGGGKSQHPVAEKLQPLIGGPRSLAAACRADMGERAGEEAGIGEAVAEARFQRGRIGLAAAHLAGVT